MKMEKLDTVIESKSKEIQSQLGISDDLAAKINNLYEGAPLGKSIDTDISFNAPGGHGSGTFKKTTWWVTIDGYFMITSPDGGTWHIVVKNGDKVILDVNNVHKGDQIHFHHKTGFKVNINVEAWWSEKRDTTVAVHIHATY
jgi:hypothetical protein